MSTVAPVAPEAPASVAHRDVSIVVPTRNEAANVVPLIEALSIAFGGLRVEVLFVDDSTDGTPDAVAAAAHGSDDRFRVELLHREPGDRADGLGGAVAQGMRMAVGDAVVVMDGDLQHPPAVARRLVEALTSRGVDLVVASRYCAAGSADGLPSGLRRLVSSTSGSWARALFPHRLADVTDPMSGFFAVRRSALDVTALRPRGFKILLEVLVRARSLSVAEIPFTFGRRQEGRSKASAREGLRFVRQLVALRLARGSVWNRLIRFGAVGASGAVVNLAVLTLLLAVLPDTWAAVAAVVATEIAIAWNFALTRRWVFGDRPITIWRGIVSYFAINSATLVLQLPIAWELVRLTRVPYEIATAVTIVALMLGRFVIADRLLFARVRPDPRHAAHRATANSVSPERA